MAWNDGSNFARGGFNMAQAMAGQQGGHLAGMANQTMAAIQRENESRVAQMREQQRMAHEKEMQQAQLDAMIQRLGTQNQRPVDPNNMGFEYDPANRRWKRW